MPDSDNSKIVISRLSINGINRFHHNTSYSCQASNTDLIEPQKKTVTLQLHRTYIFFIFYTIYVYYHAWKTRFKPMQNLNIIKHKFQEKHFKSLKITFTIHIYINKNFGDIRANFRICRRYLFWKFLKIICIDCISWFTFFSNLKFSKLVLISDLYRMNM